jgi:hypothetical protein
LWLVDRGAWKAIAANAAWTWVFGSLTRGGILDVRFPVEGDLGAGAVVVLAAAAATATGTAMMALSRRK